MRVDSVEKTIESFEHSKISKQRREPNYRKIQTIHKLTATDSASVEEVVLPEIALCPCR